MSKKFQFDVDFEQEEERQRQEQERLEAQARHAEEMELRQNRYSEDQYEAAQQESFKKGYDQGLAEAKQSLEQTISELTDRMSGKLRMLLDSEEMRWRDAQKLALTATMATLKKLWPQLLQTMGTHTVEETIRQSLELNNNEARIVVRVHDSILDAVVARLPQLKEQQAFAGKVIVLADDSIVPGDCKVEWADGGLERLSRTLSQQMDQALVRILAGVSGKGMSVESTPPESERMSS